MLDFVARMEGFDPSDTRELRKAAIFACEAFGVDGGRRRKQAQANRAEISKRIEQ